MKKTIILSLLFLVFGIVSLNAQTRDSVAVKANVVDSTLVGKNVFSVLPSNVKVHQSTAIANAFNNKVSTNGTKVQSGFRVRIFFDSKQTARTESETVLTKFNAAHSGVPAYRSYQNPFFKVTVGDFRTRSEAMQFLQRIKGEYPTAFVVKENINYPSVDQVVESM